MTVSPNNADTFTSHWPLPARGVRQITPQVLLKPLRRHPLSAGLIALAMGFYPRAEGHKMRRRKHDTHLLIYCSNGYGTLEWGDQVTQVEAGHLIYLPPRLAHAYRADSDQPWTIFWVHFEGRDADAFVAHAGLQPGLNMLGLSAALMGAFEELLRIRRQGNSLAEHIVCANHLKTMMAELANLLSRRRQVHSRKDEVALLLDYMQRHLSAKPDLDDLVELTGLSKYQVIRHFKASIGQTPIQYFIQLKMERACELLDSSSAAIKAIAADLGFNDPLYFSRQFKRCIGVSPQQYRESHKT